MFFIKGLIVKTDIHVYLLKKVLLKYASNYAYASHIKNMLW